MVQIGMVITLLTEVPCSIHLREHREGKGLSVFMMQNYLTIS